MGDAGTYPLEAAGLGLTVSNAAAAAGEFLQTIPPYPGDNGGRGIVICAGGVTYNTCAWVVIRMLRHLGCALPIEAWALDRRESDHAWAELVGGYGVQCVSAADVRRRHPHPRLGGWELKPYALLHAPFREVLLLDADNVPVADPTWLFESEPYRQTGALFWPDGLRTPRTSPRWRIFGVPYRNEPEQESGQLLVDKRRCWTALQLCNWYNRHSAFFYRHVYGDKDTFRFAWHRTGRPFAMPSRGLIKVPGALYQHDFQGRRLFQHRCRAKWSLEANRRVRDFWEEDRCLAWIDELRGRWRPGV